MAENVGYKFKSVAVTKFTHEGDSVQVHPNIRFAAYAPKSSAGNGSYFINRGYCNSLIKIYFLLIMNRLLKIVKSCQLLFINPFSDVQPKARDGIELATKRETKAIYAFSIFINIVSV